MDFKFVKMPESGCSIRVRIIPVPDLCLTSAMHYGNGEKIYCPALTGPDAEYNYCPFCERYLELIKWAESEDNKELAMQARQFKPMARTYYRCIVRGQEEEGLQVLPCGKMLNELVSAGFRKKKSIIEWLDRGRDFVLHRVDVRQSGVAYPDYWSFSGFDKRSVAATGKQMKKWEYIDLSNIPHFLSIKEMRRLFEGLVK